MPTLILLATRLLFYCANVYYFNSYYNLDVIPTSSMSIFRLDADLNFYLNT